MAFAALGSPCCYWRCLLKIQLTQIKQSKEETLICAMWWYKVDIDKDIPEQISRKNLLSNLGVLFFEVKKLKI